MRLAEQRSFAKGQNSYYVMQRAGLAVAYQVIARYSQRPVVVLAGVGNNGGDALIVAEALRQRGVAVSVVAIDTAQMKGDAKRALLDFKGTTLTPDALSLESNPVVVDGLFGIGLNKPVKDVEAKLIERVNAAKLPVVAIDMASGIEADTGRVLGCAIKAAMTVTFACKKPGHLLLPGRQHAGEVLVADIGITFENDHSACENVPEDWIASLPLAQPGQHKYDRGHVLVLGGDKYRAGAAKLAAKAALRSGAGLATIICPESCAAVYAASALSLMTAPYGRWKHFMKDARCNTLVMGPGAGTGKQTAMRVLSALAEKKQTVLDADALTSFAATPKRLFKAISTHCVLTPHAGEFAKLFPDLTTLDKLNAALGAARRSGAVVVYKGYDTVIAAPDGRASINSNAPATLATAGAGDVLAGIIGGLLAQGMNAYYAACAGVWLHGQAAKLHGAGLIAEDIERFLPQALELAQK